MVPWSKCWWACDVPYLARMFYASYAATESDVAVKTIDSVISEITWVLEKNPVKAFLAFDSGSSERKKIDSTYKLGRASPPEDYWGIYDGLLNHLHGHFENDAMMVVSPGWEADDCLATIAKTAVDRGFHCALMTYDKDCRQCLRHGKVSMQRRQRDPFSRPYWNYMTATDAEKEWNCRVDQFVDYQVLVGDAVDNVKGCSGIAETRAAILLTEYGSVEKMKLRSTFPELPVKIEQQLIQFLKTEEASTRKLVQLKDDCELFDPITSQKCVF